MSCAEAEAAAGIRAVWRSSDHSRGDKLSLSGSGALARMLLAISRCRTFFLVLYPF